MRPQRRPARRVARRQAHRGRACLAPRPLLQMRSRPWPSLSLLIVVLRRFSIRRLHLPRLPQRRAARPSPCGSPATRHLQSRQRRRHPSRRLSQTAPLPCRTSRLCSSRRCSMCVPCVLREARRPALRNLSRAARRREAQRSYSMANPHAPCACLRAADTVPRALTRRSAGLQQRSKAHQQRLHVLLVPSGSNRAAAM